MPLRMVRVVDVTYEPVTGATLFHSRFFHAHLAQPAILIYTTICLELDWCKHANSPLVLPITRSRFVFFQHTLEDEL